MEKNDTQVRQMERKANMAVLEWKEEGEKSDTLHIKAYALAFGNVDSWGDIIAHGAVDAFLASENKDRMALCYQHDINEVIGVITDAGVDEKGMWIEADVLPTTTGKDVQTLIRAGAIKEFSIGYYANEYHFEKVDGYAYDIRVLDAITIVEVSPVTRAANPQAVLLDAKNEGAEQAEEVKDEVQEDAPEIKEEIPETPTIIDDVPAEDPRGAQIKQMEDHVKHLQEALEEECSLDVVQAVHETVRTRLEEQKADKTAEPLSLSKQEVKQVLESCGVSMERAQVFEDKYDEAFGAYTEIPAVNVVAPRQFNISTPSVSIKVAPDRSDLIETRIIGGVKYIMICADENVEVNGVNIHIKDQEKETVNA